MIRVIASLICHLPESFFFYLACYRGRWKVDQLFLMHPFAYHPAGQSVARWFAELVPLCPKNIAFSGKSWLTLQTEEKKSQASSLPTSPLPLASPQRKGVDSETPPNVMVTFLKRKDKLCQTYNIAFLNNHLSPPQKIKQTRVN